MTVVPPPYLGVVARTGNIWAVHFDGLFNLCLLRGRGVRLVYEGHTFFCRME